MVPVSITHVIFEPLDFIARLAALVPKPRANLTRFHGVFAPNSKHRALVTHSSYLVSNGFVTLILDSFRKRGIGSLCRTGKGGRAVAFRTFDAFHALEYLQSLPIVDKTNIFLMGQSQGGAVALNVVKFGADEYVFPNKPKFQGVVAFYPPCGYLSTYLTIENVSPVLVLAGEKDDWTPPFGCIYANKHGSGADYDLIVYEDAHHSFDLYIAVQSFAGYTVGGNISARNDSRKQMLDWFLAHMQ